MTHDPDSPKRALIVSLHHENGEYRVSLDDAVEGPETARWKQGVHVTSKVVPENFLSLPEEELASFGYYILARLSAFKEVDGL